MRGTIAHTIAIIILLAIAALWYVQKEKQADRYRQAALAQTEQTGALMPNATTLLLPGYETNATVSKINASLARSTLSKRQNQAAFVASIKVEGKEYLVAFAPVNTQPAYRVGYFEDDRVARLERDFSQKVFLLAMAALFIKALLVILPPSIRAKKTEN